ncbi:outer-membrane lipoprotein LolB [Shewanella algidipiscicola]|uniref:Outer-membrane lipoprotein LolB n=1 Tax=Shewanella algidipiscicola TaxID=614070 RepID=A0ABQ4PI34_9GAMM|nr:outer-membrane lipoprotein LolB [Shewanella algidipiscicola]
MNYFTKILISALLLTPLLLGGCASRSDIDLQDINVSHVEQAKAWEMQGKLAVKTRDDKFSTNLYWLHTPNRDQLRLTTMLGTTVMLLERDEDGAQLMIDGNTYQHHDAEQLLKRLTGWSIPIEHLPLWITGQVASSDLVIRYDNNHRPIQVQSTMTQTPWQVEFKSWQHQSGAQLPRLLELTRENIRLKMQINQWQALTNSTPSSDNAGLSHDE